MLACPASLNTLEILDAQAKPDYQNDDGIKNYLTALWHDAADQNNEMLITLIERKRLQAASFNFFQRSAYKVKCSSPLFSY